MSFLSLNNISKSYGSTLAVEDFNLEVEQGEFISLLGPSGCGKTTTLQMIAGFEEPTSGSIHINGRDMTSVSPSARDIGIVFQSYALFPHMTVADNVSFGLEMRGIARAEREQRVAEALELVHLNDFAGRFPKALSGGQRQRVALARAIVIRPHLLLLDEPLSALDAKIREDMQIELRNIQHTIGVTTILVTHDQAEAMAMSDRIAVMNKGRLAQVGAPFDTYENPGDTFTSNFLGKTNLFDGEVLSQSGEQLRIRCGDFEFETNGQARIGDAVTLSIRPEKIHLVEADEGLLNATIGTRIFLGNCWVYQLNSALGTLQLTLQNSGATVAAEGEQVGIRWSQKAIRVLPRAS